MTSPKPHFLLFCDGNTPASGENKASQRGRWRFVLENVETGERSEATDLEIGCAPDRCALISVLRGLESLEQPSRVTLITTSRYVSRGLQYGLIEWRDNDFSWEHFGAVQPIRNADIWKRIDRTLAYHQVQCRWMAQEEASPNSEESTMSESEETPVEPEGSPMAAMPESHSVAVSTRTGRRTSSTGSVSTRSKLPTNKEQRVFVDTPVTNPTVAAALECFLPETVSKHKSEWAASEQRAQTARHEQLQSSLDRSLRKTFENILNATLFPFRLVRRGQIQLCRSVWDAMLAVDDWLDAYLRCMLLLEPRNRPSRR